MNLSGINNYELTIFACIEEHDEAKRQEFMEQLKRYGIEPELKADKIEFQYRGGRNTVLKLASYADAHLAHSINITSRSGA